jgi:signal transduction histidine kinase
MFRKILFAAFFITLCTIAIDGNAQTKRIDSLKKNIAKANTPEKKLEQALLLCEEFNILPTDTLLRYANVVKGMAVNNKNINAESFGDFYIAYGLFQKEKLDSALHLLQGISNNYKTTIPPEDIYNKLYSLKSNVYLRQKRYDDMVRSGYDWLHFAEQKKDTIGIVSAYVMIGNANYSLIKKKESLNWYLRAYTLLGTSNYQDHFFSVYNNLGEVYCELLKADSSVFFFKKGIELGRRKHNDYKLSQLLTNYSKALLEFKEIKPAEEAINESIEIQKRIGGIHEVVSNLVQLANIYSKIPEPEKGIKTCLEALELYKKSPEDISLKSSIYETLANNYEAAGDYKNLSKTLKTIKALSDSTYTQHAADVLAEMQTKYETQKKENTIIKQKYDLDRKQYFIYGIISLLLLLSVLGLMILKYRKQKQKQKISEILTENEKKIQKAIADAKEDERKRIIADLHDDVGGGLSTIRMVSDLIAEQNEQTEQLNQYALKISGITKDVTQRMNIIVWALNSENDTLQSLSEYIRQYGFSFFEDTPIEFKSNLPEGAANVQLSGLQRKNIFLCVKEALNNVYKHSGAKNAWIDISITDHLLTVIVSDDGGGLSNENLFGNGLKNIDKRMKEINGVASFETSNGASITLKVQLI